MYLAAILFRGTSYVGAMMLLPLAICAVCIVTSIIGTFFVRLGKSQNIMGALYKGLIATGVLSMIAIYFVIQKLVPGAVSIPAVGGAVSVDANHLFACGCIGLLVTAAIVVITEYYTGTGFRPVRAIAKASVSGHGTNVIQGLAVSLESTALPALVIIAAIVSTYMLGNLFGVAIAVTTMLALAGFIVALDAFGPVTDNAGGIAEMAGLPSSVRIATDALDAVGNTTKAVTKGYAIGSAGLGALVLFAAYTQDLHYFAATATSGFFAGMGQVTFDLSNPFVIVGLLFGGALPFLFGGLSMTAVGRAAEAVVEEVRRQFREIPGIMEGGRYSDQSCDPRNDRAKSAAGAVADRPLPSDPASGRQDERLRIPRRHVDWRDRHRAICGHLYDLGRRSVGQRQEIYRRGQLRRQGF
jgi:K(+)-stimulated pyrophosphate-energized sodium pump